MSKWYVDKGEQGDIVLSTRVRLARNLEEFPFPCRLDTASRIKVNEKVRDTLLSCVPELGLHYVTMDSLSREQAISLAERHLISPARAERSCSLKMRQSASCSVRRIISASRS